MSDTARHQDFGDKTKGSLAPVYFELGTSSQIDFSALLLGIMAFKYVLEYTRIWVLSEVKISATFH